MNWGETVLTILGSSVIASIISSLLTFVLNNKFNNKKLNAEIVSKSRIDWINEFRNIASNYLYEGYKSIEEGKLVCHFEKLAKASHKGSSDRKKYEASYDKYVEKYNDSVNNMTKYFIQIRLYLTDRPDGSYQKEHYKIKDDIKGLGNKLNNAMDKRDKNLFNNIQKNEMQDLADYIGKYLKKEWDRAKAKE